MNCPYETPTPRAGRARVGARHGVPLQPEMISRESLVEFRNRQRKLLRGMVHRPERPDSSERGPRKARGSTRVPGVVFFHGFTGDRMEAHWMFVKCARALAKAGIASLRFDFYGSGESEGEFREVTLEGELADGEDAVKFFRRQKGIDPERLGLVGLSLGGTVAACLAPRVKGRALVLWAALAHPDHLRTLAERVTRPIPDGLPSRAHRASDGLPSKDPGAWSAPVPIESSGPQGGQESREYGGIELSSRFLENLHRVEPVKSLTRFERPTLIIHPEKDEYLPLSHPEDFFQAAGAAVKEKVIVPGADHTFASVPWEREVIERTVDWFEKHLR